jgi:peptidoglycan-associated lipoprotein
LDSNGNQQWACSCALDSTVGAEYNKALGERRARAVRDYLTSRGIDPSRLTITSYGEERLKYDTSQEATRALNRRAALIID